MRGSLGLATVVLICDGAVNGSLLMSSLFCPIWFLVSFLKNAIERPSWGLTMVRIGIPALTLGLVRANNDFQLGVAEANARRVIVACEEYQAAHGSLPENLEDLVPRYMNAVPVAKHCLMWNKFVYSPRSSLLFWHIVPPFYRKIYNFDSRTWSYLD